MAKKIASVVGATGKQGSAVIAGLLQNSEYQIRAITRNPDSEASRALAAMGFEVVRGDISDEASLRAAFAGSHLIFGVTDWVEPFLDHTALEAMDLEAERGRNIVRAAQATPTLEHFIWSTLPGTSEATGGRFFAPNFDGKNEGSKLIHSDPALLAKTTFLILGWYDSNFQYPAFTPTWVPSANMYVVIGDFPADATLLSIGDVPQNLAPFIREIINQPQKTKNGGIVMAYIEKIGFEDALKRWAGAHDKEAVFVKTDAKTVSSLWPKFSILDEMVRYMGAYKDRHWTYQESVVLTAESLGINHSEFLPLSESLKLLKF